MTTHDQTEADALRVFGELLAPHLNQNSRLALLDPDPATYKAQRLGTVCVSGTLLPPEFIPFMGEKADAQFPAMLERLGDEENTAALDATADALEGGKNIVFVSNHDDLTGIALGLAAVCSILKNAERPPEFRTGSILSKIISRLGYALGEEIVPATTAIGYVSNDVFLSYPGTETMQESGLDEIVGEHHLDTHNRDLRDTIDERLDDEEPYLLGMAGSGTTDKSHPKDPDTTVLAGLGHGTMKIMRHPETLVLPVAIVRDGGTLLVRLCMPRQILATDETQGEDQAHQAMRDIQDTLNKEVPGRRFLYGPDGLPLTT